MLESHSLEGKGYIKEKILIVSNYFTFTEKRLHLKFIINTAMVKISMGEYSVNTSTN